MAFRMARTGLKSASPYLRDYQHFRDMGWFESAFFYPISLGPVKTLASHLFDLLGREMVKRM